jgi:chitosanase
VLNDNHGYSAGIIQFTTGTGSALQVIDEYSNRITPNEFSSMVDVLERIRDMAKQTGKAIGDISGLDNYCSAWKKASENPVFQEAQRTMLFRNYFVPALHIAKRRKVMVPGTLH